MATLASVRDFWNDAPCGLVYAEGGDPYGAHAAERYRLEPYIRPFARFEEAADRDVLEIGVGLGADHAELARARPRSLAGVDLTPAAIAHTQTRLATLGLASDLRVADAEALPFRDASFDLVYSWGVLHHSPHTEQAVREALRVLRPGGIARIMIYHKWSAVGVMLWTRYGLLAGRPFRSLASIYAAHLESPGTKAYTRAQAAELFQDCSQVRLQVMPSFGDLLQGAVGQRHSSLLLNVARALWPRWLVRRLPNFGLMLLIEARR